MSPIILIWRALRLVNDSNSPRRTVYLSVGLSVETVQWSM